MEKKHERLHESDRLSAMERERVQAAIRKRNRDDLDDLREGAAVTEVSRSRMLEFVTQGRSECPSCDHDQPVPSPLHALTFEELQQSGDVVQARITTSMTCERCGKISVRYLRATADVRHEH